MWRLGTSGVGATRAALEEAEAAVAAAHANRERCDSELTIASETVARCLEADRTAASTLDSNDAELNSTTEALHHIDAQLRQIQVEQDAFATQREELEVRFARETERANELGSLLPSLESA